MRIGIDLGGTKIEGVLLAPDGAELRIRVPTPTRYSETLDAIADLVARLESESDRRCTVGVGIPGSLSPSTGLVRNANSTWLAGHAFDVDLSARLKRPVRVTNDANCFALSEASDGAAAGADPVFGVILGTGVGGGLVMEGRVVEGASRIAGEWGHTPLPVVTAAELSGPPCYCGRRGCVESWLSGPALAADHQRVSGHRLAAEEIALRAASGDTDARATLARYVERLGRALAVVVNVVDPAVVVLGGGVSNLPDLAPAVERELRAHVFSDSPSVRVVRNRHGDSSGVRGAAWLWTTAEAERAG